MSKQLRAPEALAVNPSPKWDEGDVAAFRDYLARNPRFLARLASRAPSIRTDGELSACALSGASHAGYEELFRVLTTMATYTVEEERSPFIEGGD